jgi:sigma-E factor negative regulatory protein RseA
LNKLMAMGKQMDANKKMRDYISAFADGELPAADLELALAALREADGRETWRLYHEIGDVLRAEAAGPPALSPGFAERLAARLAAEPTPLRRGAARASLPTDALVKIAPGVVMGADPADGAAAAAQPVATLAPPELPPKTTKRLS